MMSEAIKTSNDLKSTMDFFSRRPKLLNMLFNIHHMMKHEKYDYPLVICGGTGNGKSMLLLHIIELWYRVILKQRFSPKHINHVQNTREGWIQNFKDITELDINANDEGTDGLMSKESMTKFGRDIQKLYNVFRKKLFFTILVIPDYFDLPLYFRKRVRGCIDVYKRGKYRYYTMNDLQYVNGYNENRNIKRIDRAFPHYTGIFPDYKGLIRQNYDEMAFESTNEILDNLLVETKMSRLSTVDINFDKVSEMILQGHKQTEIIKEVRISANTYSKIRKKMIIMGKI